MQLVKKTKTTIALLSLLFATIIISNIAVASSANPDLDKYLPSTWKGVSWDDVQKRDMASRFLDNLWLFEDNSGLEGSADIYNWYNGTNFGLASWESEVCLSQLSTDVRGFRDSSTSRDGNTNIYTTTITATGLKTTYYNTSYYEVSWYIMPYDANILYKAYLTNRTSIEYVAGKTGNADSTYVKANKLIGASGYYAKDSPVNFTKVVIQYKYVGSSQNNTFEVNVINKND